MQASDVLVEVRKRSGLTLRDLAARAGTSHSALAAYESASKLPTTRTMFRIVDAAGFAIDFELAPRRRGGDNTLSRSEELRQVLELAEQFPARHQAELSYPRFTDGKY